MKINFNQPPMEGLKSGQTPQRQATDAAFKNLLKDTLTRQTAETGRSGAMPQSMAIGSVPYVREMDHVRPVLERIDTLLDVLDNYRSGLADPRVSLKDLVPLIEKIGDEKQHLNAMKVRLGEGDQLNGIVEEVLVTASLELAKFNRGDYV